jgi:hypothetical protein
VGPESYRETLREKVRLQRSRQKDKRETWRERQGREFLKNEDSRERDRETEKGEPKEGGGW